MTTFGQITDEILAHLYSFGSSRDKVTSLSLGLNATDTAFTVADGKQLDRGYVEIDSELMQVNAIDSSTGIVSLFPFGRGARATTPANHLAGVMVTSNPRFPRFRVQTEINEVVDALYPDLFDVTLNTTQVVSPVQVTYQLPADFKSMVSVQYQTTGPSQMWAPVTRYAYDLNADTTSFPTGRSVDIYQAMQPGRKIKFRYRRAMAQFVNETDTFATVFMAEAWRDIIRMMVVARLLMSLEPARLELDTLESAARSGQGGVQPTAASSVGKQLLQLAAMRVAAERRQLLEQFPSTQVRKS